jgi:hypothetical protein
MRCILSESARRKRRLRHGCDTKPLPLDAYPAEEAANDRLLGTDEVLDRLDREEATVAEVVKLRYFGGLTSEEAASAAGRERHEWSARKALRLFSRSGGTKHLETSHYEAPGQRRPRRRRWDWLARARLLSASLWIVSLSP